VTVDRTLVVIAGPIGAGKSTVAALLARTVAELGASAVAVDLDDVAFMQRGVHELDELWRRAAIATAALVDAWFDTGTDVVVAHGPFFEAGGYELLDAARPDEVRRLHVLLRVSVEEALTRVGADPTRGMSRDPDFLRATHDRFQRLEPALPAVDLTFDTTQLGADEIVAQILERVRG
jgi:thymidylate kinase